jgi:NAD-reducing hydrogenase small subunit
MTKVRAATVWLDGCSGCHMSFLDLDERLIEIAGAIDLVYGPLVDYKEFPANVDVALVEGAVGTNEDVERIKKVRERTKILIAMGDCAVTGNVPAMRNSFPVVKVLDRAYRENADTNQQTPTVMLPTLLARSRPIHEVVPVDIFLAGCPPPAGLIYDVVKQLLDGHMPDLSIRCRFGA